MKKIQLQRKSKILVINIAGIGDQVMSVPALKGLHALYPDSELSLLTIPRCRFLLSGLAFIKNIYEFAISYERSLSYLRWSNIRLLKTLRRQRFDLVVNMKSIGSRGGAWKIKFLLACIKPRYTAGRNTFGRGAFYDLSVQDKDGGYKHSVEIMTDIVESLGGKIDRPMYLDIPVDAGDVAEVKHMLSSWNVSDCAVIIGFNPGSFRPAHRWVVERWIELGNRLLAHENTTIIITHGPEEENIISMIEAGITKKSALITKLFPLSLMPALLKAMHLFISNDTGPMHIAAAVRTPVIALFGPSDPVNFGPYGDPVINRVITGKVDCSIPCYKFECDNPRCMLAISVDDVYNAAHTILKKSKKI